MRTRMRFTVLLLALAFTIIAITGICMDLKILILPKGIMKQLHIYLGYFMILLALVHLFDNKNWIKNIFK